MAASPAIVRFRIILWTLVVLVALAAVALFVLKPAGAPVGVTGTPFALDSTKGGTFTQDNLKGEPSLVFFGYTFCPDVCPTTMSDITVWKKDLGLSDAALRTIFVTVDPQRDTKAVLTEYLSNFGDGVIGLVGDQAQTDAAKASFGVFSENQAPDKNGNYLVNHTATVFLMDKDGKFKGTIDYGEATDAAEGKIKRLVNG